VTGLATREERIGDALYRVHQLPYEEARPFIWLGASIVLPALEALDGVDVIGLVTGRKTVDDITVGVDVFGRAFKIFFDRATESDFLRFEAACSKQTFVQVDGDKAARRLDDIKSTHWPSRYAAWFRWMQFSFGVHFGPFSRGPSGVGLVRPVAQSTA
jgi:hypothetical protein